MKNEYEVRGDHAAIFLTDKKGIVRELIVSIGDLNKAMSFKGKWSYHKSTKEYAVGAKVINGKHSNIKFHRFLLSPEPHEVVDHINGNGLDNRRENLRITTRSGNSQNISIYNSKAKSGIRGLNWYHPRQCYRASITVNHKAIHLGYFHDIEEGKKAIEEARAKYMPFSKERMTLGVKEEDPIEEKPISLNNKQVFIKFNEHLAKWNVMIDSGCFSTLEEAQHEADKINEILKRCDY